MGFEFILIGFAAFVFANLVDYEFARPRLGELGRRFRRWMYFEE